MVLRLTKLAYFFMLGVASLMLLAQVIAKHGNVAPTSAQSREWNQGQRDGVASERMNSIAERVTNLESRTEKLEESNNKLLGEISNLNDNFGPIKDAIYWAFRVILLIAFYIVASAAKPHWRKLTKVFGVGEEE